jgi:pimeloyl-ACP methyl ester carboxylesterase
LAALAAGRNLRRVGAVKSYTEHGFEVPTDDGLVLEGTLLSPVGTRRRPAALILSGSGPIDRDSNLPGQVLGIASALARALAAQGVASARYDKRGVRASPGDYYSVGFEQETSDARAALAALRARPEVDPSQLVVIGHSLGATIAIRLAASEPIAGVVLLAATAQRGYAVLEWQTQRIAESMTGMARLWRGRFLRSQAEVIARLPQTTEDSVTIGREKLPARWFRELAAYDPRSDLAKISCPVLAITGQKDLQVDAADVAVIGSLVAGPFTGSTPPNLTHILRNDAAPANIARMPRLVREPTDAQLTADVAGWVAQVVAQS